MPFSKSIHVSAGTSALPKALVYDFWTMDLDSRHTYKIVGAGARDLNPAISPVSLVLAWLRSSAGLDFKWEPEESWLSSDNF